jgi:hypothetical protein
MADQFVRIHDQLVRFLDGDLTLAEFEDWFTPVAWDVDQTSGQAAQRLAHGIELRLAEFSNGHLTEDELRASLRPLAAISKILVNVQPTVMYGTSENFVQGALTLRSYGRVGTPREAVSA